MTLTAANDHLRSVTIERVEDLAHLEPPDDTATAVMAFQRYEPA